ncbi:MAG TPA: alpha/beta family hydrolase [Candidatus Polarisedimenticolia bacterium]|nr:alpha/beta family hydrolase [Candidatus Polarisedimenticolia bacterium]
MSEATELRFLASPSAGEVSALLIRPGNARWMYVFGHGAGAGMRHRFMEEAASALADHGIATFRYQFAYVEQGSRRIDPQPILLSTVRSAVAAARGAAPDLPLLAGGKSMGGRMTSLAASKTPLDGVRGIVFYGFPLHPAGAPATDRAEHLGAITTPMLFLQGTRDTLAGLDLLRPVVERLEDRATLHVVEGADHGFDMLKRSGRTSQDVIEELARTVAAWADRLAEG